MAVPDSYFLEIEFTAGVWTNVTAYTDGKAGATTQYGRATQYGAAQAATFSITLTNDDGRFTPFRQTLKDGVTAHPYYPNLVPRKRVRWGYVKAAVRYVRYTGYITGWPASSAGEQDLFTLTAVDRSLQLQRLAMQQPIRQEVEYFRVWHGAVPNYFHYWPLNDPAGSTSAVDAYGSTFAGKPLLSTFALPTFGVDGPGLGNGTAAQFVAASSQSVTAKVLWTSDICIAAWVNPSLASTGAPETAVGIDDPDDTISMELRLSSTHFPQLSYRGTTITAATKLQENQWALLVAVFSGTTMTLYVDGVSVGSSAIPALSQTSAEIRVGRAVTTPATNYFDGGIGHVVVTGGGTTFDATALARFVAAGVAGRGETVDARIARFLRYSNLSTSDYNLDASTVTLNTFDQNALTPLDASQSLTDTEGPGSAVYVDTDDRVRFVSRLKLKPTTPALTLDAQADIDGSVWETAYDADNVVNSSIGSQASISGTLAAPIATDATSSSTYGPASSDFTSYSDSADDVLACAQARVAAGAVPGFRLGRVSVNLVTAQADLWAAASAVRIGDRIRITNIPVGMAPASQVDLIVQGWGDAYSTDGGYAITFDTIAADNPAWFVWESSPTVGAVANAYSRWQCDQQVLNAAITSSATTLAIATPGGPTFTTDPAMYPLTITVGAEHIQLNSVPGGATSPQTFTGCTRGVDGTTAAAQAFAAPIGLAPMSTWTL